MGRGGLPRRGFLVGSLALTGCGGWGAGTAWAVEATTVIDCDQWGARPTSRVVTVVPRRPVKILVHHTATPNVPDPGRAAAELLARAIQTFHIDRRGWLDSGQHFTISRGGYVLEGRHRSLEALRSGGKHVEGAHCTGQNRVAVGIENEGTYLDVEPPGALWDSLRALCAYTCEQYGVAPTEIFGHRDFKDTACPGDRLYHMLPRLRSEVGGLLGKQVATAEVLKASWPLLRVGDRGAAVLAAQYLLRDAGMTEVVPDGRYSQRMADLAYSFQTARGSDEVTGMIGGESWPVLARPVHRGEGSDAERAVQALAAGSGVQRLPEVVTPPVWQRLLGTAGMPHQR